MPNKRNFQKELDRILETEAAGRHVQRAGDNVDSVNTAQSGDDRGGIQLPALLLHSCCAPCSSYVLEYLSKYFQITVLYYNPNIYPEEEYWKRVAEERRLIKEMGEKGIFPNPVRLIEGRFESREFYEAVRGLEQIPEGGARCAACFRLRLEETAKIAGGQTETALDVSAEAGSCRRLENADAIEFRAGECDIGEDHVAAERYDYFTTTLTISPLKNAQVINEIGEELAAEYQVKWLPCDFKKRNGYKRSIELSAEYGLYRQDYCGCVYSKREREAIVKARK
ncbi:MAG: epoxyqueuosine reductase QueH [Lachnospiraceae bacterium]|nr:epoxyqueuosine reductase QueH [Lachnospiraceae bacterium]